MLRYVALIRTDVSEEPRASFIRVTHPRAEFCEYGDESSGSVKPLNYLDWLRNHKFLKKNPMTLGELKLNKKCHLLGCDAVRLLKEPTFRRNVSLPSSGWKIISKLGSTLAVTSNWSTLRWMRYVPLKGRSLYEPHGVTSQKTAFLLVSAVKTSNLYEIK
jgi:hypothetical protein